MASGDGGERTLIKIAIFGIAMSLISTAMIVWYTSGSSDYDYDTINSYRNDLATFTGGNLTNDTPWILTAAYTPFIPSDVDTADIPDHIDQDGWLFGESIAYDQIGKAADIRLDKNQISNQLLTVGDPTNYEYRNGKSWWNGGNQWGISLVDNEWTMDFIQKHVVHDENWGYETTYITANNWNYTGLRFTFDPTLPFDQGASSKDGTLSLVWYDTGDDTGLSGGLEIYGSGAQKQVLLAKYSAVDIVNAYQSSSGYAQTFDFDFDGVHLNLSIRFDPDVYSRYPSLKEAWGDGAWSMAISSPSAGNFFDVENSNAFNMTSGSMLDTFIDIYTFQYPKFNNDPWIDVIVWLLVGLPMTLAMLCITMRMVGGVFKIF